VKSHFARLGILALAVATTIPAEAATVCPTVAEANAERVRVLQTEFMVAALKCRTRADLSLPAKYNAFVRQFTPQLVQHSKVLTAYFQHRYGTSYRQYMDKYITILANTLSQASDADPAYCDNMNGEANLILSGTVTTLSLSTVTPQHPQAATLSRCTQALDPTITADNSPVPATPAQSAALAPPPVK
jgi:hypothetical protein